MKCMAQAEIRGYIGSELIINKAKNQKEVGIINVKVVRTFKPKDPRTVKSIKSDNFFTLYIWDKATINKYKNKLKVGSKIIAKGILRSLPNLDINSEIFYDKGQVANYHTKTLISITDENGLKVIR